MSKQTDTPMTSEEKIEKYESLLEKVLNEKPKTVGTIIAGPDLREEYRILTADGSTWLYPVALGVNKSLLIPDVEVSISANGCIIDILPEALKAKSSALNDFTVVDWSEIGGMDSQIQRIQEAVEYPTKYAKIYKKFNLPPMKGIILHGPPGCGKTLIGKAIASTLVNTKHSEAFTYIKGGEMLSPYVGEAERRIKNLFDTARDYAKQYKTRAILFIDEAEAIVPQRGSRRSSDVDTTIVPTFLAEMDGFNSHSPLVVLATNYPEQLDEAIRRPGRIDLTVEVSRPTHEDAVEIFKIYLAKTRIKDNTQQLAEDSASFLFEVPNITTKVSGALIANIVRTATLAAVKRVITSNTSEFVTRDDLEMSILNL